MELHSAYPVVVVPRPRLAACRDFYVRALGFTVVFSASWFVYLASAGGGPHGAQGVTFAYPLRDEPWGQRRFAVLDSAGTWVDVVQHIDPAPGFWEAHA